MVSNYVAQRLPYQLGFAPSSSAAGYTDYTQTWDFAFGGIPFMSAATPDSPYKRGTAEYRRQQFDNSPEPGEQSLTGWWLRSQSSFHLGAGLKYEDPTEETNRFRFESSEGVDVWTPGEVSLLPATTLRQAGGTPVLCHGAVDGTTDIVLFSSGSSLFRVTDSMAAPVTWGGSGNVLGLTDDGASYYAANATGIYKGTLAGGAGSLLWNTGNANVVIAWAKQRLMAGIGPSIYQLAGGSPPTLPTATYTHPQAAWRWTAITEGPSAIYASGYAGGRSAVLRISVDNTGALPTLTQASTVAELPSGEIIYSICGYLGTFLALGTSKGVRIASIADSGVLEVGALVETPSPVKALTGSGNHVYAGYSAGLAGGMSGLLRLDLGAPLPSGRPAYATDLNAHVTGEVTGVTTRGASGVVAFAVAGAGLFEPHPVNLEAQGTLQTFRIRFSTLWPKLFKRLSLRAAPPFTGTIGVATIDQTGTEVALATVAPDLDPTDDLTIQFPGAPQQYIALKFALNRSNATAVAGPTLVGYQAKAVPGGPRPRELSIPVYCVDYETDRAGVDMGYEGWAAYRLAAMEVADSSGDLILFQDLVSQTSQLVIIERLEFVQTSPPNPHQGTGGILNVVCRAVE
jgi:hypothetical protein